jgi:8-oxo-dGTP pyrophosphatase MutT (NUDIX family)
VTGVQPSAHADAPVAQIDKAYRRTGTMKLRVAIALVSALSSMMLTAQELRGVAAGVIAYACPAGTPHFLLAFDPASGRKGWGAFGGRPHGQEPAEHTALRELREETNCAYPAKDISNLTLRGPSQDGPFYAYIAQLPYKSAAEIASPRNCERVERTFWVWVPFQALMSALDTQYPEPEFSVPGNPDVRFHLWRKAASSLRQARSDGYLSRQELCNTGHAS